jgi:hypothetical protein
MSNIKDPVLTPNFRKYLMYSCLGHDIATHKYLSVYSDKHDIVSTRFLNNNKELFQKVSFELERWRGLYKPRYFVNKTVSVYFNIYEGPNEVIFSFNGTQGWIGWINDFMVTKDKLKTHDKNLEVTVNFVKQSKLVNSLRKNYIDTLEDTKDNNFLNAIINTFNDIKDKMYFHTGFITQFNGISNTINEIFDLYNSSKRIKKIVFCGHSLGGVFSQLAFMTAVLRHPKSFSKLECYSFGHPRMGNKNTQRFIDQVLNIDKTKVFHISLAGDIVISLPPIGLGYSDPLENNIIFPTKEIYHETKCPFGHAPWHYILNLIV